MWVCDVLVAFDKIFACVNDLWDDTIRYECIDTGIPIYICMIRLIDNYSSPIIYIKIQSITLSFHLSIISMSIWIFLQQLLLLTRSMPICLRMGSYRVC